MQKTSFPQISEYTQGQIPHVKLALFYERPNDCKINWLQNLTFLSHSCLSCHFLVCYSHTRQENNNLITIPPANRMSWNCEIPTDLHLYTTIVLGLFYDCAPRQCALLACAVETCAFQVLCAFFDQHPFQTLQSRVSICRRQSAVRCVAMRSNDCSPHKTTRLRATSSF